MPRGKLRWNQNDVGMAQDFAELDRHNCEGPVSRTTHLGALDDRLKVAKTGAVKMNAEMKTHCRNTALARCNDGLYALPDQRDTCNPLLEW